MDKRLLKLAKMVLSLAEVETDKAKLIIEGESEVGKEVFIEDENGELVAPEDGEYVTETTILVIADGKIAEIREKETEEQVEEQPEEVTQAEDEQPTEEQPQEDEKDAEIARLQAQVEELNNIIVEKDEEIGRLRAELEKSDAEPAEEQLKSQKTEKKSSWVYKPRF